MIKVGINGFGRIGRLSLRVILQKYPVKILPVAINTSGKIDAKGWSHLFKYDTAYGRYPGEVKAEDDSLVIEGLKIPVLGYPDPSKIPWEKYETQLVVESTGVFRKTEEVRQHLRGTVKKVILSAPPKDEKIKMYIVGVNEKEIGEEKIISCASCTTNCVAPIAKIIDENLGIDKSLMSTIHSYTSNQKLLDGSHKDLRRARSAAVNIVPTTTGAANATCKVYPKLKGKFDGLAFRVPVIIGSLTDFVFLTKRKTSIEQVNLMFKDISEGEMKGIIGVTEEPLVSSDIVGTEYSALVDLSLTRVVGGNLVKIVAWYDNEWAYACRLVEEILLLADKLK